MKKLLLVAFAVLALVGTAPAAGARDALPPIDWDRDFTPITVLDGWRVQSCEGDAPVVCVTDRRGRHVGVVEHLSYDAGDVRTLRDLRASIRDFYETIAEDRSIGCGPRYRVVTRPIFPRPVAGGRGLSYGFVGVDAGGQPVERTYGVMAVRDGKIHVVVAGAYDDGGCLPNEGEFRVADLERFEPVLRQLVASTPLR